MAARLKACPFKTSPAVQQIEVAAEFLKKGQLEPPMPGKENLFAPGHPNAIQQHRILSVDIWTPKAHHPASGHV
jgi:hypothetical protein